MPGREEPGLGLEIFVHGPVEVQVVLGEVGEAGDVELHPVDAVERYCVRGNLHRRSVQPAFAHQGQKRVKVGGLRRGQQAGNRGTARQDLDGADQAGPAAQRLQERINKVRGGGFAVGAGNTEQRRRSSAFRPALVDQGREAAHSAAGFVNHQDRYGSVR
ncbi:hypothetical protein D9M72_536070 [compost metagenome]